MLKPQQALFKRMPDEESIQCADKIYEEILANASANEIEGLCGALVMTRQTLDHAIDRSFPKLKVISLSVSGHKGSGNRYQFVFLETKNDETFILAALDLRKLDAINSLADFDPETLRWCYLIAGVQPA